MIPKDFCLPNKEVNNYTDEEIDHRYAQWKVLDKRVEGHGTTPKGWGRDHFRLYLSGFKKVVEMCAEIIIDEYFGRSFQDKYPNVVVFPGTKKKIQGVQDFNLFITSYLGQFFGGPDRKGVREMVHYAVYGMWNNNACMNMAENTIMETVGIKYDERLSDGSKKARIHRGGCIKSMVVKKKTALVGSIRASYAKTFLEELFIRDNFTPAFLKLKEEKLIPAGCEFVKYPDDWQKLLEDEKMQTVTSSWTSKQKKDWKLTFQKGAKSRFLIKANQADHGINGLILLTEENPGHFAIENPSRDVPIIDHSNSPPPPTPDYMEEEDSQEKLLALLNELTEGVKKGNITSKRDLAALNLPAGGVKQNPASLANGTRDLLDPSGKRIKLVPNPKADYSHSPSSISCSFNSESCPSADDDDDQTMQVSAC